MTTQASGNPAAALTDALAAVKQLATDPVGRMKEAFSSIPANRALLAGLVLCAIFAVASTLGMTFGRRAAITSIFGSMTGFMDSSFTFFMKSLLQTLLMPAAMIGISFGIRRVAGSNHPIGHDAFIVGASLLPSGIASLLAGLFGMWQLALLLTLFGGVFTVLMLFTGLTSIAGLVTRTASIAVPVILGLGLFLAQRVLAIFE